MTKLEDIINNKEEKSITKIQKIQVGYLKVFSQVLLFIFLIYILLNYSFVANTSLDRSCREIYQGSKLKFNIFYNKIPCILNNETKYIAKGVHIYNGK